MAKTKKYSSFRDFYEDEGRKGKPKLDESKKQKDKFKHQTKFIDPKNIYPFGQDGAPYVQHGDHRRCSLGAR